MSLLCYHTGKSNDRFDYNKKQDRKQKFKKRLKSFIKQKKKFLISSQSPACRSCDDIFFYSIQIMIKNVCRIYKMIKKTLNLNQNNRIIYDFNVYYNDNDILMVNWSVINGSGYYFDNFKIMNMLHDSELFSIDYNSLKNHRSDINIKYSDKQDEYGIQIQIDPKNNQKSKLVIKIVKIIIQTTKKKICSFQFNLCLKMKRGHNNQIMEYYIIKWSTPCIPYPDFIRKARNHEKNKNIFTKKQLKILSQNLNEYYQILSFSF